MNMERLKYLIDKTEDLKRRLEAAGKLDQFNIDEWSNAEDAEGHHIVPPEEIEPNCGFVGCWIGWMGHENWLGRDKYDFVDEPHGIYFWKGPAKLNPVVALADYLDVHENIIREIVYSENYAVEHVTIYDVISRINALHDHGSEEAFMKEIYGA